MGLENPPTYLLEYALLSAQLHNRRTREDRGILGDKTVAAK